MKIFSKTFWQKTDWMMLILYSCLLLLFFTLQSFNDEYEHAMSGWFLLNGLLPYRDFFSHHAPLTLFLGILGYVFPGDPILILRGWAIIFQVVAWILLFRLTSYKFRPVIYLTMMLVALATPTFLLQMALANTLVNFCLLFFLILLLHFWQYRQPKVTVMTKWLGLISIICIWSSIASIIAVVTLGLLFLLVLISRNLLPKWRLLVKSVLWTIATFLVFPIYYLLIGQFTIFKWSVFTYNTQFYYPLRLANGELEHKFGSLFQIVHQFWLMISHESTAFLFNSLIFIRAMWGSHILIFNHFEQFSSYIGLISSVYWHTLQPVMMMLTVNLLLVLVILLLMRRWQLLVTVPILSLSFFFRSNEIFHLAPMFMVIALALSWLVVENIRTGRKWLIGMAGVGIMYLVGQTLVVCVEVIRVQPSYFVSEFAQTANALRQVSTDTDQIMVLNGNMVYYLLARRLPSCRYHYYLPWLHQTSIIRTEVEKCLQSDRTRFLIIPDQNEAMVQDLRPIINGHYFQSAADSAIYERVSD